VPYKIRINQPTIALFFEEGRHIAHTIPAGSIISAETVEGESLIEVQWEEKTVMMFARDVRSRGEEVTDDVEPYGDPFH
jgi:hypothetical protein